MRNYLVIPEKQHEYLFSAFSLYAIAHHGTSDIKHPRNNTKNRTVVS